MKIRRSRKFTEAKTATQDLISRNTDCLNSSQQWTQSFIKLRERFNLTQSAWEYLRGYYGHARDALHYKKLYFAYVVNGEICVYSELPDGHPRKEYIHKPTQNLESHYYWINSKGERTDKVWF